MNSRIREIRKFYHLTQTDFGKRIGVAGNTITNYESGNREPSNAVITLICKEFNVNEVWLRTGEGGPDNMFTQLDPADRFSISLGTLSSSENHFIQNAVNYLAEADPQKLKVLEEFMKSCLGIK